MRTLLSLLLLPLASVAADPPKPAPLVAPIKIDDWTPRPAIGKGEPYERMQDPQWDDKRFQQTETGPVLNCSFRYPVKNTHQMAFKATVIKLGGGKAGVAFDRNTMQLVAGWTGGFVNISERRFGLLNTPTPKGALSYSRSAGPGWADAVGKWSIDGSRYTAPLPLAWAKYKGYYLHGDRVVLKYDVRGAEVHESVRLETVGNGGRIVRSLRVGPHANALQLRESISVPGGLQNAVQIRSFEPATIAKDFVVSPSRNGDRPDDFEALLKPGPPRWGKPLVTKLARGDANGPIAVDTLTIPYDNPFKALFFCTAVDFLPDARVEPQAGSPTSPHLSGRIAMSTAHGDVWLVRVDETKDECHWQRFATGLYQPLGIKVIDGTIHVLERGQLTRLHDTNNDGEADFYECVNNDWHCSGGEHSYDTSLETDPQGNFYFHKTGDTDTPTGGSLMRILKDGSKAEVYCTGFRHPIGLGISPTGIITGADQEGNWMPATRIDQYRKGGFYGDMRAHHRATPPKTYDEPLCWLPREVDNSAGCQVWAPKDARWGALAGLPLHFSYGRCKVYVLLRQEIGETVQGGVAELPVRFLSGSRTGRFHPKDGCLYVVGLNGWQTAAKADGSLQRMRLTGKPLDVPVRLEVVPSGVKLTFSRELDAKAVADPANYRAAWWGYRWSGEYGSKRWKVSDPKVEGQDDVPVEGAERIDGKTVLVKLKGGSKQAQSVQLGYHLRAVDGKLVVGSTFFTIHATGK